MNLHFEFDEKSLNIFAENLINEEDAKRAMGKACALIERSAKELAPKDTGHLARSITSEVRAYEDTVEGRVFTPLEYAPYIEYGTGLWAENGNGRQTPWVYYDEKHDKFIYTVGQHPQPFMRPALDENREVVLRLIKEELF